MILFLASNIGGVKKENGNKIPVKFFEVNGFLENLNKNLKNNRKFVLIASNPNNYERNDLFLEMDIEALRLSNLIFNEYVVLDNRNKNDIVDILKDSDLVFLCGGNTLVQNSFFNDINLKDYLKETESVIVGISAGSINSAKDVFNSPESEDDLKHTPYLNGLGLTKINIEPHFKLEDLDDDNKVLQRNSILNESYKRTIYALSDGAYILENNELCRIFGKAYKIEDGNIVQICNDGESIDIIDVQSN